MANAGLDMSPIRCAGTVPLLPLLGTSIVAAVAGAAAKGASGLFWLWFIVDVDCVGLVFVGCCGFIVSVDLMIDNKKRTGEEQMFRD